MDEFEEDMARAGEALSILADGPGRAAADALGSAFEAAGNRIEASLETAARTGELNFSRMAEAILRDLARITAEAIFSGIGPDGPSAGAGQSLAQTINMKINVGAGGDARSVLASRSGIATELAKAAASGGRFI